MVYEGPLCSGDMPCHILGLFPWFGPSTTGGAQLSARIAWEGISRALEECGGDGHLFCYGGTSTVVDSQPNTFVANTKAQAVKLALHRRWEVDLALVWHISLLRLLPFFRLRGISVVLMLLGIEAWRKHDVLTRALLHRVDRFLSISDHTWHRFLEVYPNFADAPHCTVYLGLGEPYPSSPPLPTSPPAALMISRLLRSEDYKGHREVIAVWPLVLQRIPNAQLWIAGDGDLRPELERMARERGLEHHVRFWGWVSEEEKQELLLKSRCLALPSRGEGFGLVYLEAMRLGRPCLVSTLDAGREVVNPPEAGLAADPGDPQALADAVCRLLTSGPEWDRWSAQAKARYERHFTATHFQNRLLEVLGRG